LLAGKRKLGATPLTSLTVPLVSSLFEPQNLPVAALFPLGAAERERAGANADASSDGAATSDSEGFDGSSATAQ
jgi:hypothetical protein